MNLSSVSKSSSIKLWELRWPEVMELDPDSTLIVLPTGSIEQHGYHLPLETDICCSSEFSYRLAEQMRALPDRGTVLVAPPVWWGTSPHHMSYPGTISISMATMSALLTDICGALIRHGLYRILMVNGHGGNSGVMQATALRVSEELGVSVPYTGYWQFPKVREALRRVGESEPGGMGHACEMETSIVLNFRPDEVKLGLAVPDMPRNLTSYSHIDFRSPGTVMLPWDFGRDSKTGAMGDPTLASVEKGQAIMQAVDEELLQLAQELLALPKELIYPNIDESRFTITRRIENFSGKGPSL